MASASSSARWVGLWSSRKPIGERGQPAVGHVVAQQAAGEGGGVDDGRPVVGALVAGERGAQEPEVERGVVGDEHGVAEEVDQRAEHGLDARRGGDDGIGEAGQHGDLGRDRPAGIDQRVERAEALAAAHLDDADLGDHVVVAVAARGLEIEDAERRVGERHAAVVEVVVEAALSQHLSRHGRDPTTNIRSQSRTHVRVTQAVRGVNSRQRYAQLMSTPSVEPRHLRSALEFAVVMAREGQKIKPPLKFPPELKQVLPAQPAAEQRRCRRCGASVEGDETFRSRLAAGALPELVDPIGRAWLTRADGWEAEVARLAAEADAEAVERPPPPRCSAPRSGWPRPSRRRRGRGSRRCRCSERRRPSAMW